MISVRPLSILLWFTLGLAISLPPSALARGYRRGPSQGQVKAMQAYQKQLREQYQLAVKREQAEQKAYMDRFDTNHDGQITGSEKGPAEKFLRDRRLGKVGPLTGSGLAAGSLDPIGAFGESGKKKEKTN